MELWIQLLGAAGIGALINQYIARARERREVRANVMRALSATEDSRWAGDAGSDRDFKQAAAELVTASVIAGIPRATVAQYLLLANAARQASDEAWNEYPDPEYGGGIPARFSDAVREAARLVSDSIWHPFLSRIRQKARLKLLRQQVELLDDTQKGMIEQRAKFSYW